MIDKEVFVKEIDQTYTILKQNLVLIKYVEDLIKQGNTLEEAIDTLQGVPTYNDNEELTQDKLNAIVKAGMYIIVSDYTSINRLTTVYYVIDSDIDRTTNNVNWYESFYLLWDEQGYEVQEVNTEAIGNTFGDIIAASTKFQLSNRDDLNNLETTVENINKELPTDIGVKNDNGSQALILLHDTKEITGQTNLVKFKSIFGNQSLIGSGNIDLYTHTLTLTCKLNLSDEQEIYFYFNKDSSQALPIDSVTDLSKLYKTSKTDVNFLELGITSDLIFEGTLFKSQGVFKVRASTGAEYFVTGVQDAVETI